MGYAGSMYRWDRRFSSIPRTRAGAKCSGTIEEPELKGFAYLISLMPNIIWATISVYVLLKIISLPG